MARARVAIMTAVAIGYCQAQTASAPRLHFDVASIKPAAVPPVNRNYALSDERVDVGSFSLKNMIMMAYKLEAYQVDGPDWMASTRFDLLAKLPPGTNKQQIPEMLQALLAERFGLVLHHEAREQQVYALLPGKDGPKLDEAAADNSDRSFLNGRAVTNKMYTPEGDGFWSISSLNGRRVFDAQRITMPELATVLTPYVDDPVIDMTGLKVPYRVRLDVPLTLAMARIREGVLGPSAAPDPDGGMTIFSSVQEIGLTLERRKAPVDHVVVDHAEKAPTEN